jgi:N-formylglutamate amidohydrolase
MCLAVIAFALLLPRQTQDWVDVQQGTMALVLSAPHGGVEKPAQFADRVEGVLKRDTGTREVALGLADAIELRTGFRPFVVTSRLHRVKLDPNRPLEEAAQGDAAAEAAWADYHRALEQCTAAAMELGDGHALLLDLHGHAHEDDWIELGYGVKASRLARPDAQLADADWIRGPHSLGARMTDVGLRAVPSPAIPDPGGRKYFSGGYITRRYRGDGLRPIQLELPASMRRSARRAQATGQLADAVCIFLADRFGMPRQDLSARGLTADGPYSAFEDVFAKVAVAFGVPVFATADLPADKHRHAVAMLAEYLDNDEDGVVDDARVLQQLHSGGAFLVMPRYERQMERIVPRLESWEQAGWAIGQDLYGEETAPTVGFDAALEEIWHLVSQGWAAAYPSTFAFEKGSRLCDAMDVARRRGGHYHYDPTCDYSCQAAEYSYWSLTTLLGAQAQPRRAREIADEWECADAAELRERDPLAHALFTADSFALPRKLPDGRYRE